MVILGKVTIYIHPFITVGVEIFSIILHIEHTTVRERAIINNENVSNNFVKFYILAVWHSRNFVILLMKVTSHFKYVSYLSVFSSHGSHIFHPTYFTQTNLVFTTVITHINFFIHVKFQTLYKNLRIRHIFLIRIK